MKHNPLQYIISLLSDHLINIEEEVYDDGCGTTYHYTGEFGEDLLEIVIDDSDFDEEENMDICDFIHVNVCDRFHFEFSEYNSRDIRSLVSLLRPVTIIIRYMKEEDSIIFMVDSNLHREKILFSEKAFAYYMKNEAMKRKTGKSPIQVLRYIRLTLLIPELLDCWMRVRFPSIRR